MLASTWAVKLGPKIRKGIDNLHIASSLPPTWTVKIRKKIRQTVRILTNFKTRGHEFSIYLWTRFASALS